MATACFYAIFAILLEMKLVLIEFDLLDKFL